MSDKPQWIPVYASGECRSLSCFVRMTAGEGGECEQHLASPCEGFLIFEISAGTEKPGGLPREVEVAWEGGPIALKSKILPGHGLHGGVECWNGKMVERPNLFEADPGCSIAPGERGLVLRGRGQPGDSFVFLLRGMRPRMRPRLATTSAPA